MQNEISAIGLHLLERTKSGVSLHHSASKYGIKPPYGTSRVQDYIDEAMRCYVSPLLDYLERRIEDLGGKVTIENAAELRFKLFDDDGFRSAFPETNEGLNRITEYCGQTEESTSWFHVAVSCREVLGTFVKELQSQHLVDLSPELKQGDTKGILKQLAKERAEASDALVNLIQAVWTYVQSNVHRQSANKEDALRAYLWTGLLISEIRRLAATPTC